MSEHTLYNLACNYADQGIKLLWFKLDKTPGIAWSTESSNDRAKLHEWFYHLEPGQRRIGIKTGQDSRGVVVIDIDVNKKPYIWMLANHARDVLFEEPQPSATPY